jgi:hypothetical protein
MDGDCCMRQSVINRLGAELNEVREENSVLKAELAQRSDNSATTQSPTRCNGCTAVKSGCTTCCRCYGDRFTTAL